MRHCLTYRRDIVSHVAALFAQVFDPSTPPPRARGLADWLLVRFPLALTSGQTSALWTFLLSTHDRPDDGELPASPQVVCHRRTGREVDE